jgi:hypothetical protein
MADEDLVGRIFASFNNPINVANRMSDDIRPAHHNTLTANSRWATTDNMFASVDADGTLGIDRSGLSTETPGRSLADIIDERSRTIQRIIDPVLNADNYESARKRIVEFTNQLFESSAHFLKDANIPCPAAERAATIAVIERPEETELLNVARETVNAALAVPEVADNYEHYKQQSLSILEHYRTLGRDLMRQEQTFKDKLSKYDKLVAQIKSLTEIPGIADTDEMTNLLKSYEAALKVASERFHFGDEYKHFLQKTREWALVRDILMLHRVAVSDAQAGPPCSVCLEDHVTHALTACGHTFCGSCKSQLGRACPLCRKTITGAIKIYFS